MKYFRFSINLEDKYKDGDGFHTIFSIAYAYKKEKDVKGLIPISLEEKNVLFDMLKLFEDDLDVPEEEYLTRFPKRVKNGTELEALFWFKEKTHMLDNAYLMANFLRNIGYNILVLKTDKPGYITYEDEFQVAAQPFGDTPKPVR